MAGLASGRTKERPFFSSLLLYHFVCNTGSCLAWNESAAAAAFVFFEVKGADEEVAGEGT